jgi:hypothetical protein
VDVTLDEVVIGTVEVKFVVVDEFLRDIDERYVAGETAVVPPVGLQGWDAVGYAGIVDRENDEVFAFLEDVSDLAVEGGEAALVFTDFFSINPDEGAVVGGAEVEKGAGVALGEVLKVALIPDGALVVEEVGTLGVPIAGNLECRGVGEVVVLRMAEGVEGSVHEEAVSAKLLMKGVKTGAVLIDDDVPVAVERSGRAVINVDEEGSIWLRYNRYSEEECDG